MKLQKLMFYIRLTRVGEMCDNDGMYLRKTGKWMGWVPAPSAFLGGKSGKQGLHCGNSGSGT